MPTFEVKTPVGREPDLDARAGPRRGGRGDAARDVAAELGRLDHGRELRRQPRPRHAHHPLRAVGTRRHRDQAAAEGRRLREHERAVLAADGTAQHGTRRPQPGGRAQVHPPRGVAGAGQGLQPRRGWRVHRRRPHVRVPARQGAVVPHASTTSTPMPGSRISKPRSWARPTSLAWARWASAAQVSLIACKIAAFNRLPASFFVSVAYDCWAYRRLGVVLDAESGAIAQWLYRDPVNPIVPMIDQAGFVRTGLEVALQTPLDEATVRSPEGGRRRAHLGSHVHRPRRRARAPDEARAAGRSARGGAVSLRPGRAEGAASGGVSRRPVRRRASGKSRTRRTSCAATVCGQ